jgi:hypothetical protein
VQQARTASSAQASDNTGAVAVDGVRTSSLALGFVDGCIRCCVDHKSRCEVGQRALDLLLIADVELFDIECEDLVASSARSPLQCAAELATSSSNEHLHDGYVGSSASRSRGAA